MRTLIVAAVLCCLAAGVAHAGTRLGTNGSGDGGNRGAQAQSRAAAAGGQVTTYGTRIGTVGTGDGNRSAQGQSHAAGSRHR